MTIRWSLPATAALALLLVAGAPARGGEPVVHFAPQGDFPRALAKELLSAKKTIDIALYSFQATSKQDEEDYAQAFVVLSL